MEDKIDVAQVVRFHVNPGLMRSSLLVEWSSGRALVMRTSPPSPLRAQRDLMGCIGTRTSP